MLTIGFLAERGTAETVGFAKRVIPVVAFNVGLGRPRRIRQLSLRDGDHCYTYQHNKEC